MRLHKNTIKDKWPMIKIDLRKVWGKLTDDELESTKRDIAAIGGLIQHKYGGMQGSYSHRLSAIFSKMEARHTTSITE